MSSITLLKLESIQRVQTFAKADHIMHILDNGWHCTSCSALLSIYKYCHHVIAHKIYSYGQKFRDAVVLATNLSHK